VATKRAATKEEAPPDEVDLRRDGRAVLRANGTTYTLRRPVMGELRRLRELYDDLVAAEDEEVEAREQAEREAAEAEGREWTPPTNDLQRALRYQDTDAMWKRMEGWMRSAFDGDEGDRWAPGLSDTRLPEDFDLWPTWFVSATLIIRLVRHWQTVPLDLGVPLVESPSRGR
jgi:hypothetical protein